VTKDEISEIYQHWVANLSKNKKLTIRRIKAIEEALILTKAEDLKLIIEYIFNADDEYASYIRGANSLNKEYTDLLNILRIQKISDKLERAKTWKSSRELPEDDFGIEIK
jgi:hypothetical protein